MDWIGYLLVLASATTVAETRLPQLQVEERIEYYAVLAKDRPTLIKALRVPGTEQERGVNGQTRAAFVIDRRFTQTSQGCVIHAFSIRLELHMILPRWAPDAVLPYRLEADWTSIRDRIVTHENKHKQNALDAAFAMRDRFSAAAQKQNCIEVERALNRAQVVALNNQQLRDRVLDQRPVLRK